jgi:octaprenyl-diphosphate synthase
MEVIKRKTATLFEAGTQLGALLAELPLAQERAMADYGLHLGIAFQLVDDALDYSAKNAALGKNIGDDLAEGKPTLPVIRAMANGTEAQRLGLRRAIENGGREHIEFVGEAIASTGAIEYTIALARGEAEEAKAALSALPASPQRNALAGLAEFAVSRTY